MVFFNILFYAHNLRPLNIICAQNTQINNAIAIPGNSIKQCVFYANYHIFLSNLINSLKLNILFFSLS